MREAIYPGRYKYEQRDLASYRSQTQSVELSRDSLEEPDEYDSVVLGASTPWMG